MGRLTTLVESPMYMEEKENLRPGKAKANSNRSRILAARGAARQHHLCIVLSILLFYAG